MQQVVQGQVGTLEQRASGWVAVHINVPGKQYPVKLSTKKPEIIGQAQSLQGQMVDALYNEVQSDNLNPHTNEPYMNRYLEALSPAGQMAQPQPQAPQQFAGGMQPMSQLVPQVMPQQPIAQLPIQAYQPGQPLPPQNPATAAQLAQQQLPPQGVVTDTDREGRIMRQSAAKVAAHMLTFLGPEEQNMRSLIAISEQLLKYFREGVSWTTNETYSQLPQQQQPATQGFTPEDTSYENQYQPGDDDVPF